jgi:N-acetylglucosamine-6-phosphate deacetylase
LLHRHENPVLAQLGEDSLAASFIADGIHLPLEVLRTFIRAKGPSRTVLVTDAMSAAGAPPGRYTIGDLVVEVGKDRIVRQPGSPNFAGSALTMNDAVANTVRAGLGLPEAWIAASTTPAKLLQRFGGVRVNPAQIVARKRRVASKSGR